MKTQSSMNKMVSRIEFGNLSEENIAQIINIMFNGRAALTNEQIQQLEDINEQIDEFKNKQEKFANQIFNRRAQINDLRREFRQKIKENCIAHSREEIEKTDKLSGSLSPSWSTVKILTGNMNSST